MSLLQIKTTFTTFNNPRCDYELHKKSFIPRCLYRNCNCWTVSFFIVCFYACLSLCVFMSLFYNVRFFSFFSRMSDYCYVQFVACTFVTCCNKDQSINQSINYLSYSYQAVAYYVSKHGLRISVVWSYLKVTTLSIDCNREHQPLWSGRLCSQQTDPFEQQLSQLHSFLNCNNTINHQVEFNLLMFNILVLQYLETIVNQCNVLAKVQ